MAFRMPAFRVGTWMKEQKDRPEPGRDVLAIVVAIADQAGPDHGREHAKRDGRDDNTYIVLSFTIVAMHTGPCAARR
jgi:hypothetical protein